MSAPAQDPLSLDLGVRAIPAAAVEAGTAAGLVIIAYGEPAQQGDLARGQYGNLYHSNKKLKPWRDTVADATRDAVAELAPDVVGPLYRRGTGVGLSAVWTFRRSGAHFGSGRNAGILKDSAPREHVHSPDLDKLLRAIFDALTAGGAWHDDRQVCRIDDLARVYPGGHHDSLQIPGVVIRIRAVPR